MAQYYGVTRSGETLSHYGVKGMKWGVRKAVLTGNDRALDRHYRKAAKKLAKLTDIGVNSKKYAAKSAAYGVAAAGTGTIAVGGTGMASKAFLTAGDYLKKAGAYNERKKKPFKQQAYTVIGTGLSTAGEAIDKFGKKTILKPKVIGYENYIGDNGVKMVREKTFGPHITGNTVYRIGTGAVTAGLAAKSAQNAYRASHGAKYRAKAQAWKNEMDQAFKGTQYEGHYEQIKRKRRKRN